MISEALIRNQINRITFVMVDITLTEVPGLGVGFVLEVSKNGGAFNAATGVLFGEISDGWYYYDLTAAECNTIGPLSVIVNGVGCIQQNLEYVVQQRTAGCISFAYTVTDSVTLLPISNVSVWFSTDVAGTNIVWSGITDAFGVARDAGGFTPCLDAGTYSVWKQKVGYTPDFWPDTEIVS
jgi:hypothetical protein